MSLRFKGADLRPVLAEAEANKCRVVLVKDHGVYFLAERGERTPEGRQKLLAYAIGCNPDFDPFDDWLRISEHRDRPFRLIVTAHFGSNVTDSPPVPKQVVTAYRNRRSRLSESLPLRCA